MRFGIPRWGVDCETEEDVSGVGDDTAKRRRKLKELVESEGYPNLGALLRDASIDSACPGICMSDGCDCTAEMEPDQHKGWCEV